MVEYRSGAHAIYDIKYHVVWITKYHHKVLRGRLAERARDHRAHQALSRL